MYAAGTVHSTRVDADASAVESSHAREGSGVPAADSAAANSHFDHASTACRSRLNANATPFNQLNAHSASTPSTPSTPSTSFNYIPNSTPAQPILTHSTPTQPQHPQHTTHLSNLETLLKEEEARLDRLRDDQHRLREGVSSHSTPVSDNQKPEQKREPVRKPNDPVPQTETVPATPLRVKPSAREESSQLKGAMEASRISHEERIQVKTQELLQRVEDMKKRNEASKRRKEEKGMTTPSRPLPPQSSEWVVLSASKSVIKMEETEGESEREEFHFVHFFADHFPRSLQTERE